MHFTTYCEGEKRVHNPRKYHAAKANWGAGGAQASVLTCKDLKNAGLGNGFRPSQLCLTVGTAPEQDRGVVAGSWVTT